MFAKMQPGGTKDFGYCQITMTSSRSKSVCSGPEGISIPGGNGVGFVVTIPHHNLKIYHAGDTAMFSDMKIIDDLYQPDIIMLPVGEIFTMGAKDAAYAVKNFFATPKTVIPMCFNHNENMSIKDFDFEGFVKLCEEMGVTGKTFIHP